MNMKFDTSRWPSEDENRDKGVVYTINENHAPDQCRLISNGLECRAKARAWGLCTTHHSRFNSRKDGSLEKYGMQSPRGKKRAEMKQQRKDSHE